jgi:large subunit ribosomal protein L29
MKPVEIREFTDEELNKKENDIREELFNLRIQLATNQTTNVSRIRRK